MIKRFLSMNVPMGGILTYLIVFNFITNWFSNGMTIVDAIIGSLSFTLGVTVAFFLIFAVGELLNGRKK